MAAATTSSACSLTSAGTTTKPNAGISAPSTSLSGSATRPIRPALNSQLGILGADRGGPVTVVIAWHVKALTIRLRLSVPQAVINLRHLAACRREPGAEPSTGLPTQAAGDIDPAEAITSLLDQVDAVDDDTA